MTVIQQTVTSSQAVWLTLIATWTLSWHQNPILLHHIAWYSWAGPASEVATTSSSIAGRSNAVMGHSTCSITRNLLLFTAAPFKNSHRKLSVLSSCPYSPFTQQTILVLMNSFSAQGFSEWYTSRDPKYAVPENVVFQDQCAATFHSFKPKCCSQFMYTTKITTEDKNMSLHGLQC